MGRVLASAVDSGAPVWWSVRRTMTDSEAVMWRMEADPRLRSPVAAVEEVLSRRSHLRGGS